MPKIHSSRVFLISGLALLLGIFVASFLAVPLWLAFLLAAVGLAIALVFWKPRVLIAVFGIVLMFFSLGAARAEMHQFREKGSLVSLHHQGLVRLKGTIVQDPQETLSNTRLVVETEELLSDPPQPISGRVLVFVPQSSDFRYGEKVIVEGKVVKPEPLGDFDYPAYLAQKDIYSIIFQAKVLPTDEIGGNQFLGLILILRPKLEQSIRKIIPQPYSGILRAIMLGDEGDMTPEFKETLNRSGLRHIIAISGMNITIISVIIMGLLLKIGLWRNQAFFASLLMILAFVLLVGAPVSAVRAGIMGSLLLLAQKEGRLSSARNSVVGAGAAMALFDPNLLRWDIGFQLSFLAVIGLFSFTEYFKNRLRFLPEFFNIRETAAMTISAQLPVLPVLLSAFQQAPLFGVFSNIIILPFLWVLMVGGFLAAILGMIWSTPGSIAATPLIAPLWLISFVAEQFSQLPVLQASLSGALGWLITLSWFGFLAIWAWGISRKPAPKPMS